MSLPSPIEYKLSNFLNPQLTFDIAYQQYAFNNYWLIDITENYLKKDLLAIIESINGHLKIGSNTKVFLKDLLESTDKRLDWYQKYELPDVHSIHKIIKNIKFVNYSNIEPLKEKYSINELIAPNLDFVERLSKENNYYFDLYRFKKEFDNYSNPIDFENVKLNYVLEMQYEYVLLIRMYLDSLIMDFEKVDFKLFDFEPLLIEIGLFEQEVENIDGKCNTSLKKIDLAHLFHFLVDEKVFTFHPVERQNQILMKKFIEKNFTYQDDEGLQKDVINIKKEFYKISLFNNFHYHRHFIKSIIEILETRSKKY